jgi:hypothetical protein
MAISFGCVCGKQLKVTDEFAGKRARCPACAGVVIVPMPVKEPLAPEDAAFEMLSEGPDPAPAPRVLKPAARQWEEVDEKPYQVNTALNEPPTTKKSTREIPKFKAKKIQRREARNRGRSGVSINSNVVTGGLLMLGAVVWLIVGLAAGWIFYYPPIMFIGGLVTMVKGFAGHED